MAMQGSFFSLTDNTYFQGGKVIAKVLYKPTVLELRPLANMPKLLLLFPGCVRMVA